jgi:PKD repeat protein
MVTPKDAGIATLKTKAETVFKETGPDTKIKPDIVIMTAEGIGAITSSATEAKNTPSAPSGKTLTCKKSMSDSIITLL